MSLDMPVQQNNNKRWCRTSLLDNAYAPSRDGARAECATLFLIICPSQKAMLCSIDLTADRLAQFMNQFLSNVVLVRREAFRGFKKLCASDIVAVKLLHCLPVLLRTLDRAVDGFSKIINDAVQIWDPFATAQTFLKLLLFCPLLRSLSSSSSFASFAYFRHFGSDVVIASKRCTMLSWKCSSLL